MHVWSCRGTCAALVANHLALIHILTNFNDEVIKMTVDCGDIIPMSQ